MGGKSLLAVLPPAIEAPLIPAYFLRADPMKSTDLRRFATLSRNPSPSMRRTQVVSEGL
jgi:hypothetical protein